MSDEEEWGKLKLIFFGYAYKAIDQVEFLNSRFIKICVSLWW